MCAVRLHLHKDYQNKNDVVYSIIEWTSLGNARSKVSDKVVAFIHRIHSAHNVTALIFLAYFIL
jgi:hypothetical protein